MDTDLTQQEVNKLRGLFDAYDNAQQISDLPDAGHGDVEQASVEMVTAGGEPKKFNFFQAVHSKEIACRRWNETLATPTGEAFGNIDFLRALPSILGLGCYLVADDRTKRKLDPTNHYRFSDGSPAALDGSMGQYMWCWDEHYFCTKKEGNYLYEAVSLEKLSGWECYRIPEGGTSALGFGVLDRTNSKLCSLISNDPRFRGGYNQADWDGTYRSMLGKPATSMAGRSFSIYARNRGLGWEAGWYVARAVEEYLFRIIMGTRNCQAAYNPDKDANGLYQGGLGKGVTEFNYTTWLELFSHYPIIPCAVGVELADGVGVVNYDVRDGDDAIIYTGGVPVFLGLKHLYGHLWRQIRGLIIDVEPEEIGRTRTYVAPSMYDYVPTADNDNTVAGMILASEQPRAEGYIKKQSMSKLCCTPTEVGGSSGTYFCDYWYSYWQSYYGLRCRLAGGSASDGTDAGAFGSRANNAVATSGAACSAPLCFFTEDPIIR